MRQKSPVGIMFHNFHDEKFFKKSLGSISSSELKKIINKFGKKNIVDPKKFILNFISKKPKNNFCCLTFDDGLKSQIKIALPVLKKKKIKAFFFIPTSIITNQPNLMELYRYFRDNYFKGFDDFYESFLFFLKKVKKKNNLNFFLKKKEKLINKRKKNYPFYSIKEIQFRIIRDIYLNKKVYEKIMLAMFKFKNFNHKNFLKKFYINTRDIKRIEKEGHAIGLHTHNHPMLLEKLSYSEQKSEFLKNLRILRKIIDQKIISASFPTGSYNIDTINILNNLKIEICFRDNNKSIKLMNKNFEIPRVNHSEVKI